MTSLDLLDFTGDLLDMLPEIRDARQQAATRSLIDGLTVLRDSIPEALECVTHCEWFLGPTDKTGASLSSNGWGYLVCKAGIGYSEPGEFPGFDGGLPSILTWDELRSLVGNHPDRQALISFEKSLPQPNWKDLARPHEMWPNADDWHPSYIAGDHERPSWPRRLRAWQTLIDLLNDVISGLQQREQNDA